MKISPATVKTIMAIMGTVVASSRLVHEITEIIITLNPNGVVNEISVIIINQVVREVIACDRTEAATLIKSKTLREVVNMQTITEATESQSMRISTISLTAEMFRSQSLTKMNIVNQEITTASEILVT